MTVDNVWPYVPESGFTETYSFLTEVLRSYSSEQRIRLRKEPRLTLGYSNFLSDTQLAQANLKARRYGMSNSMQIPVWGSMVEFNNLTSGQTTLDFGNDYVLYFNYNTSQNVIIWQDWDNYIVRGISGTTPTTLTLDAAIGENISTAFVMPLRTAVNYQGYNSTQSAPNINYINTQWTFSESTDAYGLTTYDIYDLTDLYETLDIYNLPQDDYNSKLVQKTAPYRISPVDVSILQPVTIIDNGFGPIRTEPQFDYINQIRSVEWFFNSPRTKATEIRDFFCGLEGRQKSWYMPSYKPDLNVVSGTYNSTTLLVTDWGTAADLTGRAIMIVENNGTQTYRAISSAVETTNGIELTLDSSITLNTVDLDYVSFLDLVRFDTDEFTITHSNPNQGYMRANVIEVPV